MPREPDRELHALNETLTQQTAELARTRDALRASEERFRLVVSNIPGAPTRLELTALDPVAAIYIANLLVAEQAAETGDGNWETLDEDYLAGLGVADKLDSWRNLAAEHIRAAEAAD